METVRSVVTSYVEGKIELDPVNENLAEAHTRFSPSFIKGDVHEPVRGRSYTATTVADSPGCTKPSGGPQHKVQVARPGLQMVERGVLEESNLKGLRVS